VSDKPRAFVFDDKTAIDILHRAGYRIVRIINPHPGYDGDTILNRAARCYLAGAGNYSRDALERALLGLGLDPAAPWRSAAPEWPPPRPGTHESDLDTDEDYDMCPFMHRESDDGLEKHWAEFDVAAWSRANREPA
jgi:hypothetical protein